MSEPTPLQSKMGKLREQLRLDELGKSPPVEKYDVVVPSAEPMGAHQPAEGIDLTSYRCGVCDQFKTSNPLVPFGQCLIAQRVLGATLYRSDLDGCSLTPEQKKTGKIGKFF